MTHNLAVRAATELEAYLDWIDIESIDESPPATRAFPRSSM